MKESILLEAEKIVTGSRAEQYGDQKINFKKYADIVNLLLDEEEKEILKSGLVNDTVICKVMISIKLGRESHKHKRDNLVDLCGYSYILDVLK